MKNYEANKELAEILFKHGFVETTSKSDSQKGKRSFKLFKHARKEIYFDYINIRVFNSIHGYDSRIKLSESELKSLLLYFKLTTQDFKEIDQQGRFDFKHTEEQIEKIRKEIQTLTELKITERRIIKLKKILGVYDNLAVK